MKTFNSSNWDSTTVVFIQSLVWSNRDLILTLLCQERENEKEWPNREGAFKTVEVWFKHCTQFKLNFEGATLQPLYGLTVLDISAHGWENINFQIADDENDCIGFYCEAVEVL